MSRTHPDLQRIAEKTTERFLDMLETGLMDGRDSDGNITQVPLSAAMYGKILEWLRVHHVTMDLAGQAGDDIATIAARMKARGVARGADAGVAGKLPPDDAEEDVA